MQANGIPFRFFSVVVENAQRQASTRLDAERWAETFGLCSDIVLHCNGDPNSPLRNLTSQFASANGNNSPGYPTYVLVDPTGVVRYYQAGADLDQLQAELAALTGKTLTQTWVLGAPPPSPRAYVAAAVRISGRYDDDSPIDETIDFTTFGTFGPDFAVLGPTVLPLNGFTEAITTTRPIDFDPYTPLKLTFTPTSPPVAVPYTRLAGLGSNVAYVPDDGIDQSSNPWSVDTSKVLYDQAIITSDANGVTFDLESIANALLPRSPGQYSTIWFNDTMNSPSPERWSMAYSLADTLIADVANSNIALPIQTRVAKYLTAVLHHLQGRSFNSAALQAQAAAKALAKSAGDIAIQADASWLASHLATLANQP